MIPSTPTKDHLKYENYILTMPNEVIKEFYGFLPTKKVYKIHHQLMKINLFESNPTTSIDIMSLSLTCKTLKAYVEDDEALYDIVKTTILTNRIANIPGFRILWQ